MQEALKDEDFAAKLIFSDEATFHLSGEVNSHNVRLWGTANPRVYRLSKGMEAGTNW
jgi:hypothetical protein